MIKYVYLLFMINNLINFRNFKLFNTTKIIILLKKLNINKYFFIKRFKKIYIKNKINNVFKLFPT